MAHPNGFRETIEDGGVVLGARSATFSPTVVELYGEVGLDFVWLDFEHTGPSPYDSTVFEALTRAAEVGGTDLLVRLPTGDPALVRKVLDAGVRNLLIPRVDTVEEVRSAVRATRFVYDGGPGDRGLSSSRANTWGNADGYVGRADETACLGVMIEKRAAADRLDDILAVPDLGFVFVGPSDLSVQLGHPGDRDHPEVAERFAAIRETCLASDVPLGALAHDPDGAAAAIEEGCQIVRIGGELEATQRTLAGRLAEIRDRR